MINRAGLQRKVAVIGLDCAEPSLVFGRWIDQLPHLRSLMESGTYGTLTSTVPPITVPAWSSMMTGNDPGQLGIYGFRNRSDHSYEGMTIANSSAVKAKTVWNILSINRKISIVLGVPQTYPPKPLRGLMVGCFLTPSKEAEYTYPADLKHEIDAAAGGDYVIDVRDFRTDDKDRLLAQIHAMTEKRFKVARHLVRSHPWDFFMMVEMGTDRLHHGFWRYCNPDHRLFQPGNPYEHVMRDYYRRLDGEIGELLKSLPPETTVLVVSDHGAKSMRGAICVNEWLVREGLLVLKNPPDAPAKLTPDMIDWPRTTAWGEGGYYGRIFMNVQGREPLGVVPPERYEEVRDDLASRLAAIPDENGNPIGTKVFKPEEVYREVRNVAPDLIVYFGDLNYRSAGSVGTGAIHRFDNDTGPDDANHAQQGLYLLNDRPGTDERYRAYRGKRIDGPIIYDVASTVLDLFSVTPPSGMIGLPLWRRFAG